MKSPIEEAADLLEDIEHTLRSGGTLVKMSQQIGTWKRYTTLARDAAKRLRDLDRQQTKEKMRAQ